MSKKSTSGSRDYSVGRGKPPEHTRFKPGQSGNPSGRRQSALNLKTVLTNVLEGKIELTENGRRRTVPLVEALILRLVQEGLSGRGRAIDSLLDRYERHVGTGSEPHHELADDDRALLDSVMNRMKTDAPGQHGTEEDSDD